jgi:hypothetical protein
MGVYGMTYEQFWREDPWIAKYYREAYVERRKEENRRDWLMGAYAYNAVATALSNAFKKKGTKPDSYLEEPFRLFPPTKEEIAEANRKEKERVEAVYKSLIKQQRQRQAQAAAKEQEQQDAKVRGS